MTLRAACLIFASSLTLGTSPVAAQDGSEVMVERTPESAVAFLDEFLRETRTRANVYVDFPNFYRGGNRRRFQDWRLKRDGEAVSSTQMMADTTIASISYPASCVSDVILTDLHYQGQLDANRFDLIFSSPGQAVPYRIDWSEVSILIANEVREADGYGLVLIKRNPDLIVFKFQSLEELRRAEFAMKFLQAACVPRSTTGF